MEQNRITVIFTCFNRKEKTTACIRSLAEGNKGLDFSFVVVDDGSRDGTPEQLEQWNEEGMKITLLHGDGNLYWAGGMQKAIAYAKEHAGTGETQQAAYYLLVNDDVEFYPNAVEKLIAEAEEAKQPDGKMPVMVGAMCDAEGNFSYGGIRYQKGIHYEVVKPQDKDRSCDSFNMNCLLVERETFLAVPNFDTHYVHSLADFDYGLEMKRRKIPMLVADFYAGKCQDNDAAGGWTDRTLSRRERLRQKESVKGAPFAPWFYFLKKNFGIGQALLHGFTPYLRILLGK